MTKSEPTVRETLRIIILVTTVSALFLAVLGFSLMDLYGIRDSLATDLVTLADVVASESAAALMFHDQRSALQTIGALRARPSIVNVRLYDAEGKSFVSRDVPGDGLTPPMTAPAMFTRFTMRGIEVARPVMYGGELVGTLYLASDLRQFFAHLKRDAWVCVVILIGALLVAFFVSLILERTLSDPILRLSAVADRVRHEKNYSLRTPTDQRSPREIRTLMSAFNDMLAEIEMRDEVLQNHREDLRHQVEARTAELRATAELNESLSRHQQAILDTAGEGIFGLDSEGVATFINASAAHLLGYRVEEIIGRRLHDIVHAPETRADDFRECVVCTPGPMIRDGRTDVFVTRDGVAFPVEYTSSAMSGNRGSGVVVTFRDITERLAIERMKDEFVSTVSHELRTPLTSIRGALGLLSGGLLGNVTERGQRMLNIAVTSTDRLVRLINDILDLERISLGRVQLNRKVISAATLMRDAADVVQTVADRAGVTLEVATDSTPLWVDSDRIVQTLTNLIGNAVKFSPRGSAVRVSGHADEQGDAFVFTVSDDGRGIPTEKLQTIFERFQQVDASDSRDKGGSGLGLAICRSIVSAHAGTIWAASRLGEGSAFHFTVPLHIPASEDECITPAATPSPAGDSPVLLVEDDDDLARVVVASLESRGIHTIVAVTGAEAIAACANREPSAMILDVGLPEGDGFAVVEWLRGQPALRRMPLLVYSASDLSDADQERLNLGQTLFLPRAARPSGSSRIVFFP